MFVQTNVFTAVYAKDTNRENPFRLSPFVASVSPLSQYLNIALVPG